MEKKKKTVLGRIFRGILWIAGIWVVLLVALQIVLSSPALGKIVEKFTADYFYGNLRFETIKVNMFRHFPNVGIVMENGSLTYRADRFDEYEARSPQGLLLYAGCGEIEDTLASFSHFSASINVAALAAGNINIPHVSMAKPRIFAHSFGGGDANWNIVKLPENQEGTEKPKAGVPPMEIGGISLTDHPHIVFTSSADTLFAMIDMKEIAFNGRLDTENLAKSKLSLEMDSVMVAGRMAADTIRVNMDMLHLHEHRDHMDIKAEANALLATKAFGRMDIPVSIEGTAGILEGDAPGLAMHGFKAEIAAVPIGLDMEIRKAGSHVDLDGSFSVNGCKVEKMIDGFIKNIVPEAAKIRTNASVSLSGTVSGGLGSGKLPKINGSLKVPESSISHSDIRHEVFLALDAGVRTDRDSKINVTLNKASLKTYGLDFRASGEVADLLGEDPIIKIESGFTASADSLITFLPEDTGIEAVGSLTAEISGGLSLSHMNLYNFGNADIAGKLASDRFLIRSPKDTIDIDIEGISLSVGPETRTSSVDTSATFRLLSIGGSIGKAGISLKDMMFIEADGLEFAAKNSVDAISRTDTTKVHPLGGHLTLRGLSVEDGEGMALTMEESSNSFQMTPQKNNPGIPVFNLRSTNRRIEVSDSENDIILSDARIDGVASKVARNIWQVTRNRGIARQRNLRLLRANPAAREEDELKYADIDFTLKGAVAEYFRNWDVDADLNVPSGILSTPMLPLRNIITDLDICVTNNAVKINSARLLTGDSEIAANGSLSGLRRALLGEGKYNLSLDITSDRLDAAQLLAAVNTGSSSDESLESETIAVADEDLSAEAMANAAKLIVIPSNVNAEISMKAGNISFSDLLINEMTADIAMRDRCMQITNTEAKTNMGELKFEGYFATRSKKEIQTGFTLNMNDITSEKVIAMMPALDTIMPIIKSFKGMLNCDIAATADLDTNMNILLPTINGVMRVKGDNLTVSENKMITDLAKKLKFNDPETAKIERMVVEGAIKDNSLEVFPFILELDRYTLALSGIQNLDMSYRYHASILRSPIVFKVGVDIYGPDFENMSFNIGKPKYKNTDIPVFSAVIDETRASLTESIRGIFNNGTANTLRNNGIHQQAIIMHKKNINFVNAANVKMESLSEEEQQTFDFERSRLNQGRMGGLPVSRQLNTRINTGKLENE